MLSGCDVRHFSMYSSDHAPILLSLENRCTEDYNERFFRFKSYWLSQDGCKMVVSKAWNEGVNDPVHLTLE